LYNNIPLEDTFIFRSPTLYNRKLKYKESYKNNIMNSDIIFIEIASTKYYKLDNKYVHHILYDDKRFNKNKDNIEEGLLSNREIYNDIVNITTKIPREKIIIVTHIVTVESGSRYELSEFLEQTCKELNIKCINPVKEFKRRNWSTNDLFETFENPINHYSKKGHEKILEVYKEYIDNMCSKKDKIFNRVLKNINESNDKEETIYHNIITPFTGYFISDYYLCEDVISYARIKKIKTKSKELINHIDSIEERSIIYVENNLFGQFVTEILDKINTKFILITTQTHLPRITDKTLVEQVLSNDNVLVWFSNNPLYVNKKYRPFPYGVNNGISAFNHPNAMSILNYCKELNISMEKKTDIAILPLRGTHKCREQIIKIIPKKGHMDIKDYYTNMNESKFILSPIGDRDDCYRHWEAIGLGCVPISNVNKDIFYTLFGDNMIYMNVDEMIRIYKNNDPQIYIQPNRDLICVDYWRDLITNYVKDEILS
jgi:hypothetical protein